MTREELEKRLHVGVNEDGIVEGHVVETYLAEVLAIWFPQQYGFQINTKNRFISFIIDNGPTNLEVRLPFEIWEKFPEWILKKGKPDDSTPT